MSAVLCLGLGASRARAENSPIETKQNELTDLLLLEVHLDNHVILDGLNAYREGQLVYVPLGELSRSLTIALSPNADEQTASGFVISEDRPFRLDAKSHQATVGKTKISFEAQAIRIQQNEIFVESGLYSKLVPVDLSVDVAGLTMKVTARESLPIQARLKRESRNVMEETDERTDDASFLFQEPPYALYDRPFLDQTVEGSFASRPSANDDWIGRYTGLASGDVLGLETNLLITAFNRDPYEQHRITAGRSDPDARLLGPLRARGFSFGNITLPALGYAVHANSNGVGGIISNRPLSKASLFDTQTLTGDLPPGWDVELFHNGVLIAHQSAGPNARYEFTNIALLYGSNDFRLVFHGPLGQTKEIHHRFLLEDSMVLPGERYYTMGAVQMPDGSTRTTIQVDQSLLPSLSATVGSTSVQLQERTRSYFNSEFRSYWDSVFFRAGAIAADDGGTLESLGMRTGFGDVSLALAHAFLQKFTSEEFSLSNDSIVMRSEARIDTALELGRRFPITFEGKRDQFQSGLSLQEVSAKISAFAAGLSLTPRVIHQSSQAFETTNGEMQIGGRIRNYGLRGTLSATIDPVFALSSFEINGDYRLSQAYTFTQSLSMKVDTDERRYELGLNRGIGAFGFGVHAGYSSLGEIFTGLRMNMGLGFEPRTSQAFTSAQPLASTGAASVRVFLDRNMNGEMDDGDTPLPNIGFKIDGGQTKVKTNEQGVALLTHLQTRKWVNIGLDMGTIEDPQLTPKRKGYRLLPRSGKVATLEFPVITTTEIDGTLTLSDGGKAVPAAGINLELVDAANADRVISRTTTAHDGFYVLTQVPPGLFNLRIAPEQASRLRVAMPEAQAVKVLPNSKFVSGIDFKLRAPAAVLSAESETSSAASSFPQVSDSKAAGDLLYYVILGAYAERDSFTPLLTAMDQLKIPYVLKVFEQTINKYRIHVARFQTEAELASATESLKPFGFRSETQSAGSAFDLLVGPYYSEVEAKKDKAMLSGGMATIGLLQTREKVWLTEVAVGGFRARADAEKAAEVLKSQNFSGLSVQRRSSSRMGQR